MISITEWQKIGVGTTGFGVFFVLFGILLYFDAVLLAFGNLLFLVGLSLIIGLRKMLAFFFQRHKLKGTSFFLGGVVIVLLRWPLLGMCLETYGFFNLFNLRALPGPASSHQDELAGFVAALALPLCHLLQGDIRRGGVRGAYIHRYALSGKKGGRSCKVRVTIFFRL
nr:vesicle transport protein GOT1A isoform X1 [Equus asinus]